MLLIMHRWKFSAFNNKKGGSHKAVTETGDLQNCTQPFEASGAIKVSQAKVSLTDFTQDFLECKQIHKKHLWAAVCI